MRETCARTAALRVVAVLLAGACLGFTTLTAAHASERPSAHALALPAAIAPVTPNGDSPAETMPEAEPTAIAVETDPFAPDGYLDELLIGSAAAITVLLLGGYLMRKN